MNQLNKLIKKKSGQNVADFVRSNFEFDYYAWIASVTHGTIKARDIETVLIVTGITEKEFFDAFRKSYKGPKEKQVFKSDQTEKPKFTKSPEKVNNPFR